MNNKFPLIDLGDVSVMAVGDGAVQVNFDLLKNIDENECREIQKNACVSEYNTIHINAFLVRKQNKTILIDSGAGGFNGWGGELVNNLAQHGITPGDIDTILFTHAHFDHIGGVLSEHGEVLFPRAELLISSDEFNYINADKYFTAANDRVKGNILFARNIFNKYHNNLRFIDEGEVLPGIFAIPLKGHTPGHTGYRIAGKNGNVLIWGDVVHFPHIQLLKPEVSIAFDYDPQLAIQTRMRILDRVSSERMIVGGAHLGSQGFGYVEKFKSGYKVVDIK